MKKTDRFELAERYGGPDYGVDGARILAARFALENRDEFVAWLQGQGIEPTEALAWAERMANLHRLALRGLGGWAANQRHRSQPGNENSLGECEGG